MVRSLRGVYIDSGTSPGGGQVVADIFPVGAFCSYLFPSGKRVSVRCFQGRRPEPENSTGVPAKLYRLLYVFLWRGPFSGGGWRDCQAL